MLALGQKLALDPLEELCQQEHQTLSVWRRTPLIRCFSFYLRMQ